MSSSERREPAYAEILQLDRLVPLAGVRAGAPAEEGQEMRFFLAVHQAHELWFSVVIADLDGARSALAEQAWVVAAEALERAGAAAATLVVQMRALEALPLRAFAHIREELGSASGLQSAQYRELEFACGLREARYMRTPGFSERERGRLQDRFAGPSLSDALREQLLPRLGARPVPQDAERVVAALREFDRQMHLWRDQHVRIAARFIGDATGTAGSEGTAYLEKRRDQYLFGDLVDVMTRSVQ